jgi:hypothetical protein
MQGNQTTFDIKHLLDYKVGNIILISKINIMEVELLRLNTLINPSLKTESVTEIRIIYTLQGKTWQHDVHMISRILRTSTVCNDNQGVGLGPTSP